MGDDDTYSDRYPGYPKGSHPPAFVALEHGSGRIIFAGDYSGIKHDVYDNRTFILNILTWLAGTCPASPLTTQHFNIYYSTEGDDAVNSADNCFLTDSPGNIDSTTEFKPGSNGVPDFVERVALSFEKVWKTCGDWEYPQGHSLSSDHYTVTIKNIDTNEYGGGACYPQFFGHSEIEISNALSEDPVTDPSLKYYLDKDRNGIDDGGLLHLCAHEYFHAIQIRMTPHWGGSWIVKNGWHREGSACYMGYKVSCRHYNESNDRKSYYDLFIEDYLRNTVQTLFKDENGYPSELYWHFLGQNLQKEFDGNGKTIIKRIWDIWSGFSEFPDPEDITKALALNGHEEYTVDDTFKFFTKANYFWDQWYDIPPVDFLNIFEIYPSDTNNSIAFTLEKYGVKYFKVIKIDANDTNKENPTRIIFDGDDNSEFFVYVYADENSEEEREIFKGESVEVFNNTVIIVGRLEGEGDGSFQMRIVTPQQQHISATEINNHIFPLAQYNISKARELSVEAQDLLAQAQARGVDTAGVEDLIERADIFLVKAQEYLEGGNYIAANIYALEAVEAYKEVVKLLENLLS